MHEWTPRLSILAAVILPWLAVCLSAVQAGPPAAKQPRRPADPIQRAAMPADGKIILRDYGCKDWGPELVQYRLDTAAFKPGRLVLLDEQGRAVPFQIEGDVLAFAAALGRGQTVTYTLQASDRDRSAENTTLTRGLKDGLCEIGNEFLSLRLPAPGKHEYAAPIPAEQVPPPIAQWRQAGFDWIGGARFITGLKIAAAEFAVARQGPACVEYVARYRFAPAGEFASRIRIIPAAPLAIVTDEFDAGRITEGTDMLVLDLHKGWQPAVFAHGSTTGEERRPQPLAERPLEPFIESKRGGGPAPAPVGGQGESPAPHKYHDDLVYLDRVIPGYGATSFAVMGPKGQGVRRTVGVVPLNVGSWRRAIQLTVWHKDGAGVQVALPITSRLIRWPMEITDDQSPFSTHEHDEDLSPTFGRRVWGLYFGDQPHLAQNRFGQIGLDRYKDWTVDCPEAVDRGRPKFTYPRAFFTPRLAERLRATLAEHPARAVLERYYIISGRTEDAVAHARSVIDALKKDPTGNWSAVGLTHYRQGQFLAFVNYADDALACPDLPADLRAELRRWLAIWANLLSEPDINPRGAGVHLGNNNMTFNRTLALPYFAGLLPDHPRYDYWMGQMEQWLRFKLATQTAVDGPFIECPSYQLYGPARYYNAAVHILRNGGKEDLAARPYLKQTLWYLANLTMNDVRFGGRIIPGMGNSSNLRENFFGLCIAALDQREPEFAGFLKSIHGLMSRQERWEVKDAGYDLWYLPDVPARPAHLKTAILPTYGAVFRNRFGTPNETAMLFRAGMHWSHWDSDYLNVILYAKGAPLSPGTGYQYYSGPATENNAVYHNQVKVARRDLLEVFGRVDGTLVDYGLGDEADYAAADRYYAPELLADGKGEMHWRRHIVFLKDARPDGTDYFVMRDTFPNGRGRPAWWTWLNLDTADLIRVDGKAFDTATATATAKVPVDKIVGPDEMPTLTGQVIEMATRHGAGTTFWFTRRHEVRARMTFKAAGETKTIIEAAASGGGSSSASSGASSSASAASGGGSSSAGGSSSGSNSASGASGSGGTGASGGGSRSGTGGSGASGGGSSSTGGGEVSPDFFYVVWPHKDGQKPPVCEQLAPACIRIRTDQSTDYVFISDEPVRFEADGVLFEGKAGAVRVYADRVAFCYAAGAGRIGYKGCLYEGFGPFERVTPLAELKPGARRIDGGYEKTAIVQDIGQGIQVAGEGPFEARLDGRTIIIRTTGRPRVLHITRPEWMLRPQHWIDGAEYMACWTDYPASYWGRMSNTNLIGVSVPGGQHELTIRNMAFPAVWTRQFQPMIPGALHGPAR